MECAVDSVCNESTNAEMKRNIIHFSFDRIFIFIRVRKIRLKFQSPI